MQVMSTSSKLIVFALDHNGTIPSSIPPHSQLDYLNDLPSRDEKDARLAAYERVLFVRNPYARLYSAWKNKYVDMPGTCKNVSAPDGTFKRKCDPFFDNWIRLGYAIYKFHNMPAPAYDLDLLRGVTWRMFVDAVLAGAVTDKHWATQVCAHVCQYRY